MAPATAHEVDITDHAVNTVSLSAGPKFFISTDWHYLSAGTGLATLPNRIRGIQARIREGRALTLIGVKSMQSTKNEGRAGRPRLQGAGRHERGDRVATVFRAARTRRRRLLRRANHQRWDSWLVSLDNACAFGPGPARSGDRVCGGAPGGTNEATAFATACQPPEVGLVVGELGQRLRVWATGRRPDCATAFGDMPRERRLNRLA
jgi:hypothetical protein